MTPMLGLGRTLLKSSGFKRLETGWTPAALGGTLALWLDANDASTITLNGSTVSQWRDKSGNGRHASQVTQALQPTYVLNALNGKSVMRFVADSDNLNLPPLAALGSANLVTVHTTTDTAYLFLSQGGASKSWIAQQGSSTGGLAAVTLLFLDGVSQTSSTTRDQLYNAMNNRTSIVVGTNIITADLTGTPVICGYGGGYSFSGDLPEFIITSGTLSTTDRQLLEGYLAWKWGLVANLPSGHPFKNSPPIV